MKGQCLSPVIQETAVSARKHSAILVVRAPVPVTPLLCAVQQPIRILGVSEEA